MGDLDQGFEPTENVDHSQSTLGFDASLSEQSSGDQHNYIMLDLYDQGTLQKVHVSQKHYQGLLFSLFLSLSYGLCNTHQDPDVSL